MRILIEFLAFLEPYGTHSYVFMFGVLLLCGFGFPMPEDIVLITGGILSARGITDFWSVNAVCLAGVLVGDGTIYCLGRRYGPAVKQHRFVQKIMSEKMDQRVSYVFNKYGDKVIFMARFMPGLRTPIFLTSGTYQVSAWKFFGLDGLAALISVPLWVWVGHVFGENLEVLEERIRQFQFGIYGLLGLLAVGFVVLAVTKKRIMKRVDGPAA
jgi:membrane protein DedA with SNARE-associated domain